MIYGYVRISTKQQSIERQIRNIKSVYNNAYIVEESFTGTTLNRPQWNKLYSKLQPNDVIVFDSVSRMARNSDEGFKTYEELFNRNIDLIFLKEPQISTVTYKKARNNSIPLTNTKVDFILEGINKYLMELAKEQIILAFDQAEKEVNDLHQRTKEGLITAKLQGKILGRKTGTKIVSKISTKTKEIILKYSKDFGGSLKDSECIKLCGCSEKSYYKYKRELKEGYQMN